MINQLLQSLASIFAPKPQQQGQTSPLSYLLPLLLSTQASIPQNQSNPSIPTWVPQQYQNPILEAAGQHNVPPAILAAIGRQESGFNPQAVGPQTQWGNAQGMFQFLPSTARGMGINPLDPVQAANATAKMLADNYKKFGDWRSAAMAHHGGPNTKIWGPKTRAYGDKVMGYAGEIPQTPAPTQQAPALDPRLLALLSLGGR